LRHPATTSELIFSAANRFELRGKMRHAPQRVNIFERKH
jgi:hypothetical protein